MKSSLCHMYIYRKAAKEVIKFIQLLCCFLHFNITVYTILNFFPEFSF